MKRLILALAILAIGIPTFARPINPPKGFPAKVWNSTLALYGTYGSFTHFICTTEIIDKIEGGYRLLSAGHCVQEVPEGMIFSVTEYIGGPLMPVKLVKAVESDEIDISTFDFLTKKKYPRLSLGEDTGLRVGDRVMAVHFAWGIGEQLSYGRVSSTTLISPRVSGVYAVQMFGAEGMSGAAVISLRTHRIVGVLVDGFSGPLPLGFAALPISKYRRFLVAPNQPHPKIEETK